MGSGRFCPNWEPLISTDPKVSWRTPQVIDFKVVGASGFRNTDFLDP
jgi:hypothetical protein